MNLSIEQNNYLYVPDFISTEEANSLAEEFFIAQQNKKFIFDPATPSSPSFYNLLPCVKLLVKKVPFVSELLGEDVLPTYTYGRIYATGEVLKRHRDRDACEISFTLNLKQSGNPWPIWIQKPNGEEVSLSLNPGNAMMYLGCKADHWRETFQEQFCVQLFLHYVRANGPQAYTYFDRERKCL
jgi:hypothetical protein